MFERSLCPLRTLSNNPSIVRHIQSSGTFNRQAYCVFTGCFGGALWLGPSRVYVKSTATARAPRVPDKSASVTCPEPQTTPDRPRPQGGIPFVRGGDPQNENGITASILGVSPGLDDISLYQAWIFCGLLRVFWHQIHLFREISV